MKTPEEWIRILYTNAMCLTNNNLAKNIISDIQTEAYNQALDDLMNEVEKSSFTDDMKEMLRQMTEILKLLKK